MRLITGALLGCFFFFIRLVHQGRVNEKITVEHLTADENGILQSRAFGQGKIGIKFAAEKYQFGPDKETLLLLTGRAFDVLFAVFPERLDFTGIFRQSIVEIFRCIPCVAGIQRQDANLEKRKVN